MNLRQYILDSISAFTEKFPEFTALFVTVASMSGWVATVTSVINHLLENAVLLGNLVVVVLTIRYMRKKTRKLDQTHPPLQNDNDD